MKLTTAFFFFSSQMMDNLLHFDGLIKQIILARIKKQDKTFGPFILSWLKWN